MSLSTVLAMILTCICAYTDLRSGLIRNAVTVPAIGLGPIVNLVERGFPGLSDSAAGLLVGLALGLLLVRFRVVFGGDAKLIAAFGALAGFRATWVTTVLAILILGIQGIGVLLLHGDLQKTCANIAAWGLFNSAGYKMELAATAGTMPAAPAFFLAALIVLARGGVL